jgi:hypothetical protein
VNYIQETKETENGICLAKARGNQANLFLHLLIDNARVRTEHLDFPTTPYTCPVHVHKMLNVVWRVKVVNQNVAVTGCAYQTT